MRKRNRWVAAWAWVLLGGAFLATAPAQEPAPAGFGEGFGADRGEFLGEALEQQRIQEQILATEVQEGIRRARDIMSTAPDRAIQDLKYLLESVDAARDVPA
jgi:hypothetical protein